MTNITGTLLISGTTYDITGVPVTTPPVTPPPVTPPVTPPATGSIIPIPARIVGGYWASYEPQTLGTVSSAYNLLWIFNASVSSTGVASFNNPTGESSAQLIADVKAKRAAGVCCIVTVGGANVNVPLTNRTNSTNFVASIEAMYKSWGGFDGIDFDIETNANINSTELVWIAQQLKTAIPGFNITWAGAGPSWITNGPTACKAMVAAGVLDLVGVMCYDWPESTESAKVSTSESLLQQWAGFVGNTRICFGLELPNNDDGPDNTFGNTTSALQVWSWALKNLPGIRGVDIWNTYEDARTSGGSGGTFVSVIIPQVKAS